MYLIYSTLEGFYFCVGLVLPSCLLFFVRKAMLYITTKEKKQKPCSTHLFKNENQGLDSSLWTYSQEVSETDFSFCPFQMYFKMLFFCHDYPKARN